MYPRLLGELTAFVAVADHASFTRAAKHLNVSPASLSVHLRELEQRLGLRLLERSTRHVAPTEAGSHLLERFRPLLGGFQDAVRSVQTFRDAPSGDLRITVAQPVARFVLGPVVPEFLRDYPGITLEISVDSQLVDIVANHFDAGIRLVGRVPRDMISVRVMDEIREIVVASPAYLAARGEPRSLADLRTHDCIRIRLPGGRQLPWAFLAKGKRLEPDVHGPVIVNEAGFGIATALEGLGILYILEPYVSSYIREGRLVQILKDEATPSIEGFALYYPSRRHNSAALQAFAGFLRASLRRHRDQLRH